MEVEMSWDRRKLGKGVVGRGVNCMYRGSAMVSPSNIKGVYKNRSFFKREKQGVLYEMGKEVVWKNPGLRKLDVEMAVFIRNVVINNSSSNSPYELLIKLNEEYCSKQNPSDNPENIDLRAIKEAFYFNRFKEDEKPDLKSEAKERFRKLIDLVSDIQKVYKQQYGIEKDELGGKIIKASMYKKANTPQKKFEWFIRDMYGYKHLNKQANKMEGKFYKDDSKGNESSMTRKDKIAGCLGDVSPQYYFQIVKYAEDKEQKTKFVEAVNEISRDIKSWSSKGGEDERVPRHVKYFVAGTQIGIKDERREEEDEYWNDYSEIYAHLDGEKYVDLSKIKGADVDDMYNKLIERRKRTESANIFPVQSEVSLPILYEEDEVDQEELERKRNIACLKNLMDHSQTKSEKFQNYLKALMPGRNIEVEDEGVPTFCWVEKKFKKYKIKVDGIQIGIFDSKTLYDSNPYSVPSWKLRYIDGKGCKQSISPKDNKKDFKKKIDNFLKGYKSVRADDADGTYKITYKDGDIPEFKFLTNGRICEVDLASRFNGVKMGDTLEAISDKKIVNNSSFIYSPQYFKDMLSKQLRESKGEITLTFKSREESQVRTDRDNIALFFDHFDSEEQNVQVPQEKGGVEEEKKEEDVEEVKKEVGADKIEEKKGDLKNLKIDGDKLEEKWLKIEKVNNGVMAEGLLESFPGVNAKFDNKKGEIAITSDNTGLEETLEWKKRKGRWVFKAKTRDDQFDRIIEEEVSSGVREREKKVRPRKIWKYKKGTSEQIFVSEMKEHLEKYRRDLIGEPGGSERENHESYDSEQDDENYKRTIENNYSKKHKN